MQPIMCCRAPKPVFESPVVLCFLYCTSSRLHLCNLAPSTAFLPQPHPRCFSLALAASLPSCCCLPHSCCLCDPRPWQFTQQRHERTQNEQGTRGWKIENKGAGLAGGRGTRFALLGARGRATEVVWEFGERVEKESNAVFSHVGGEVQRHAGCASPARSQPPISNSGRHGGRAGRHAAGRRAREVREVPSTSAARSYVY